MKLLSGGSVAENQQMRKTFAMRSVEICCIYISYFYMYHSYDHLEGESTLSLGYIFSVIASLFDFYEVSHQACNCSNWECTVGTHAVNTSDWECCDHDVIKFAQSRRIFPHPILFIATQHCSTL
jgi:hypothetical protein